MKRPRHLAQDDHAATTECYSAGDGGVGQEVLDVAAQPSLLQIETAYRALASTRGRGAAKGGHDTGGRSTWILIDLLDGLIRQAGLLGHGLGDGAIKKWHTEPLSHPRPDHTAAGAVKRGQSHDGGPSFRAHSTCLPMLIGARAVAI